MMKKRSGLLAFLLVAVMAFSMCACDSKNSSDTHSGKTTADSTLTEGSDNNSKTLSGTQTGSQAVSLDTQTGSSVVSSKGDSSEDKFSPVQAKSKKQILEFMETNKEQVRKYTAQSATADSAKNTTSQGAGTDYTKTNTQVEGLDEGDIIKVDGSYIYMLSQSGVVIVQALQDGSLKIVSQIRLTNYVPIEMYIVNQKMVLIGGVYEKYTYRGSMSIASGFNRYMWMGYDKTDVRIYDITDRNKITLERHITTQGNFNTSRIKDNKLYFIMDYYFYYGNEDNYIPKISDNTKNSGKEYELPVENIFIYNEKGISSNNYLIIGKLDISGESTAQYSAFIGGGGTVYVSNNNVYIAQYDYSDMYKVVGNTMEYNPQGKTYTQILKIGLDTLKHKASGRVEGTIKDRYSLDEYNNYLRIVTTVNIWGNNSNTTYNNLFVLNDSLATVGSVTNIAKGETVYSVRFNKTEGNIVTFKQIDPLFKLDLRDPKNPKVSKGLKEEGVSLYLHPIEGTDYLIGLGRDTKDMGDGRVTWKGLKVTLYNNSGEDPVAINTITIGNAWSYSEALYNPKAILYDKGRDIFAFTAEEWNNSSDANDWESYKQTNQALYVFGFASGKLTLRATLGNFQNGVKYQDWYDYYDNSFSYIKRGARIGNYIYTISDRFITSYNLAQKFSMVQKIEVGTFPSARELFK